MITLPPGVRVLVWPAPVDFRRGMDSLAALVQVTLRLDPFAGDVFVFRSRRQDRVKLILYDGTGLVIPTTRNLFKEGLVRFTARRWRRGPAGAGAMGGQTPCPNQHRRPRW
jgi:transposase